MCRSDLFGKFGKNATVKFRILKINIHPWFLVHFGEIVVHFWFIFNQYFDNLLVHFWSTLAKLCSILGPYFVNFKSSFGKFLILCFNLCSLLVHCWSLFLILCWSVMVHVWSIMLHFGSLLVHFHSLHFYPFLINLLSILVNLGPFDNFFVHFGKNGPFFVHVCSIVVQFWSYFCPLLVHYGPLWSIFGKFLVYFCTVVSCFVLSCLVSSC